MNSLNSDKQNDSTINGREGRDERADENSDRADEGNEKLHEALSEESAKMNDEDDNEFDQTRAAGSERSDVRDESPEVTDLLRQASLLLRRKFFTAAKAGEFGHRGQGIREQVAAAVDEALSEKELESLTDSLDKIVDVLGRNAEGASAEGRNDEWDERREFAGRRGYAARRECARRFGAEGRSALGQEYGFGGRLRSEFGPEPGRDFESEFGLGHVRTLGRGFDSRGDRGPRRNRNPRRERDLEDGWGSRREWAEDNVDEGRFDHHRRDGGCGSHAHSADHRGRSHRAGGRRGGKGRMVGAAFEHGFAAGYKRGVRS